MRIEGSAWTFGNNINTDLIYPKTHFRAEYAPGEMASHLMSGIDEGFAAKTRPGDVIVAGLNFGCGSSREEAAASMREAQIGAVVASSFGRLFTRNSINHGLPVIAIPGIERNIAEGDRLTIDLAEGKLRNLTTGFEADLPGMAPELVRLMQDGGIAAYTRRILEARKAKAM